MTQMGKRNLKKVLGLILILTMTFTTQLTVFAADTSKTVTSSQAMSIALNPGATGNSSTITFNFNSLPSNAIVTKVEVDASNARVIGGLGAILAQSLTITNPLGESKTATWGRGNVTSTSAFIARSARGSWSVYMTGKNIASASSGSQFIGGTKYSSVTMKISYVLE